MHVRTNIPFAPRAARHLPAALRDSAHDLNQYALDRNPARVKGAGSMALRFDRRKGDFVTLAGIDLQGAFVAIDQRSDDVSIAGFLRLVHNHDIPVKKVLRHAVSHDAQRSL
jgi:hypothetical protein